MIVLDTNVIAELMRATPAPAVFEWIAAQDRAALYTTTINKAEILFGVANLPEGRRRHDLSETAEKLFSEDFAGRVLPFTSEAAEEYATLMVARRRIGRPLEGNDALIAATARSVGAGIATRNTSDFTDCGIALHDPWQTH